MFTLIVENYRGAQMQLVPNGKYIVELEGITGNKATINTSVTGSGAGSLFNSSRVEDRPVSLTVWPQGDIEKNRIALYKYFQSGKYVKLIYKNGSREAFIEGYVDQAPDGTLFTNKEALDISIKCNQPYWKSETEIITDISDVTPLFTFPFAIDIDEPIPFSEIVKGVEKNVVNNGDVESGVIIELQADGTVKNPIIYDGYGGSFGLVFTMQDGDLITINTYKGNKAVTLLRSGVTINIFKHVVDNPTWFTLEPGDNVFMVEAENSELLQIRYKNYNLYEGV